MLIGRSEEDENWPNVGDGLSSPKEFNYGRNELVSLIKRYYELLVEMAFLETEDVRWPPEPEGWSDSELNIDSLRLLVRNETVVDLLRHIPYPRENHIEIQSWAMPISYLREHWRPEEYKKPGWHQKDLGVLALVPFDGYTPLNFICLTQDGSTVGTRWVIDTEQGCIYPHGSPYFLFDGEKPPDTAIKWWLHARAISFAKFFKKTADELFSLKLVMRDWYREYGWPRAFRESESEMDPEELGIEE
ncbi:hypothetical protein LZ31DRAFT_570026 [Colletotrichum somersetense]|nr:hypothetical protein LZ31DRAFT_570026 [Colletotrichum somersetense]